MATVSLTTEALDEWNKLEEAKFRCSLAQARIEAGLTIEQLAKLLGDDITNVLAVEGRISLSPTMAQIRRYAKEVGVAIQYDVHSANVETPENPAHSEDESAKL